MKRYSYFIILIIIIIIFLFRIDKIIYYIYLHKTYYELPIEQKKNIDTLFYKNHLYTSKFKTFGFTSFFKGENFNMLSVNFEKGSKSILLNPKNNLKLGNLDIYNRDKFNNSEIKFYSGNFEKHTTTINFDIGNENIKPKYNDTIIYKINKPLSIFQNQFKILDWNLNDLNTERFLVIYNIESGYTFLLLEIYKRDENLQLFLNKCKKTDAAHLQSVTNSKDL